MYNEYRKDVVGVVEERAKEERLRDTKGKLRSAGAGAKASAGALRSRSDSEARRSPTLAEEAGKMTAPRLRRAD